MNGKLHEQGLRDGVSSAERDFAQGTPGITLAEKSREISERTDEGWTDYLAGLERGYLERWRELRGSSGAKLED